MLSRIRARVADLDRGGVLVLIVMGLVAGALLYPFAHWLLNPSETLSQSTGVQEPECWVPRGYFAFQIPIQPRIECVRYLKSGAAPVLDLRAGPRPNLPFEFEVDVLAGRVSDIRPTYPDPPPLNERISAVCKRWQGYLRYAFPFTGRFLLRIRPDLTWELIWLEIDPDSFPGPHCTVCYVICPSSICSRYVLPIVGLDGGRVDVSRIAREVMVLAQRCQGAIGINPLEVPGCREGGYQVVLSTRPGR
ncbi:MAG: hypothetical protein ONB23_13505 [candidate division KSB1 bacterium]|nr:hypothetical protein [candidate division KSB1 bacterium]